MALLIHIKKSVTYQNRGQRNWVNDWL